MTKSDTIPVIVLDCDFRSQSGVIQTFGRKGIPVIALSSVKDCPAFYSRYVSTTVLSPSLDDGELEYIEFLLQLPYRGVLIYSNDPCAVAISKHQQELHNAGYLLNISDPVSLEATFDKWECYKLATSLGIPMAKTLLVEDIEDIRNAWAEFGKPVILKGTTLAGGMYHKLNRREQIETCWEKIYTTVNDSAYASRRSRVILQEWHEYDMTDNWSCETVFDHHGEAAGFFSIKRIRCSLNDDGTYSSRLFAGHHVNCPELVETTKTILSTMKWRGFAHVEYFYVPELDTFMLTEVNPRLPGYSYYPGAAGFDMAYYYYADLVGVPYSCPSAFPESIYFETFHYPGDLDRGLVHMLKGNITPLPFLSSYFRLLAPGRRRVVDPIRFDDPLYTLHTQLDNIRRFGLKSYNYIRRRLLAFGS